LAGSSSFLGQAFLRLVSDFDCEVIPLNRAELYSLKTRRGFEMMLQNLPRKKPLIFLNLVGYSASDHKPDDIESLVEAHCLVPTLLMELASEVGALFLQIRSYWEHIAGRHSPYLNLYSATRRSLDPIQVWFARERGLRASNLYICDTFGTKDTRSKLLPSLIRAYRSSEVLLLGSRNQVVDLLSDRDVALGIYTHIRNFTIYARGHKEGGRDFSAQLSSGHPVQIGFIVDEMARIVGRAAPVAWDSKKTFRPDITSIPNIAQQVKGWEPSLTIDDLLALAALEVLSPSE
jgi:hypothetical protein